MEKLNVNVETSENGVLEIRQGEALPLKEPVPVTISGDIHSVANFIKVRKNNALGFQVVDKKTAIVLVDRSGLSISLDTHPGSIYNTSVKANLSLSDEIKTFSINQGKTFTKQELVKLLRFNRLFFDDFDKHTELLAAYQKLRISANTDLNHESDQRGNKAVNYAKSVTSNIPTEFILNIPIFKGMYKTKFRVEICLDVTDGGARFWFESVELNELIISQRDGIINEELKACEGLVIIDK